MTDAQKLLAGINALKLTAVEQANLLRYKAICPLEESDKYAEETKTYDRQITETVEL